MDDTFVPATSTLTLSDFRQGPECECGRDGCPTLPVAAWRYLASGQILCFPGHEPSDRRLVLADGFVIAEGDD